MLFLFTWLSDQHLISTEHESLCREAMPFFVKNAVVDEKRIRPLLVR